MLITGLMTLSYRYHTNQKVNLMVGDVQRHTSALNSLNGISFQLYFYAVLHPFKDYFRSYETGQSVGGAKTGEPREKNT